VQPVAVLLDTGRPGWVRRVKNLRGNIRREGWGYVLYRLIAAARALTDRLAYDAAVSPQDVLDLLRKAFPERCFSLHDLSRRYGFEVRSVGNLNSPAAIRALTACNADLGIVVGTRILKRTTFNVPKLGSINLHKGKTPEYRGIPPGFWELYDGAREA